MVGDKLGIKFGRLTVVEYLGKGKHRKHYYKCLCECGESITLPTSRIATRYAPISCGCYRKEVLLTNRADPTKHGLHKHPLYSNYYSMLSRCYNPNNCRYQYYGAKGIKVCSIWKEDFMSYYNWSIENGYKKGYTLDRLDPSLDYFPENCEWVTRSENSRRMNIGKHGR